MSAYYFGFSNTDVSPIDGILSAVATAGKGFHHTESWSDDIADDGADSFSYVDLISARAKLAANSFDEREALLREAADFIDHLAEGLDDDNSDQVEAEALIHRIRSALGETNGK